MNLRHYGELDVELLTLPLFEWPAEDVNGFPLMLDTDDGDAVREFLAEHAEALED